MSLPPSLVSYLAHQFNRFQTPFALKTLVAPSDRADSFVIYAPRRFGKIVAMIVRETPIPLRADTPWFTLRLAPGIAVADDPPGNKSFGETRSRLVALGILDADECGADRLASVRERFIRAGLDWERPWLRPGQGDLEDLIGA